MKNLLQYDTAVFTSKENYNKYKVNSLLKIEDYDLFYPPFTSELIGDYKKVYVIGTEACSLLNLPALFVNSYNYVVLPILPKNHSDLSYQLTLNQDIFLPILPIKDLIENSNFLYISLQLSGESSFLSIYDNNKKSTFHYSGYLSKNEIDLLKSLSNAKVTLVTLDSKHLFKTLEKLNINYQGQILDVNLLYYIVTGEAITAQDLLKSYNYYWNTKLISKNIYNIYSDLYNIASKQNKLELYKSSILIKNILLDMELRGVNLAPNKEDYSFYQKNKECDIKGKFHPYFNQLTSSGRIYANAPPITNTPREERNLYVPHDKNKVLFSMDFNQIEYRIMASLLNLDTLILGFKNNIDFHTSTAMLLYGEKDPLKITPEQRQEGKQVNFSVLYGQSLKTALPKVKEEFQKIIVSKNCFLDSIRKNKEIVTPFSRAVSFTKLDEDTRRKIFNFYIQSTATDVVLSFLIKLKQKLVIDKKPITVYNIIHDSIILETYPEDVDYIKKITTDLVETELNFEWLKVKLLLKYEE